MGAKDKLLKAAAEGLMDFIPQMVDAAQARGAQIIDMLTSGRAGEITDEMLDLGDPVANARLGEYLFKNYDLPMDSASRMARAGEMGFDTGTPLYHGTAADFTGFDPEKSSDNLFYFTQDKNELGSGNITTSGQGSVIPTYARISNPADQSISETYGFDAARLENQGYNGMKLSGDETNADWVVAFTPEQIRSRFARFDPRLSHLRNLSAGVAGGVPLGLMSMPTDKERR